MKQHIVRTTPLAAMTAAACLLLCSCGNDDGVAAKVQEDIDYCAAQALRTLDAIDGTSRIPVCVPKDSSTWKFCTPGSWWTCGFWAGELWYLYEGTGDPELKQEAVKAADALIPVAYRKAESHDVGFMIMPGIGGAYKNTSDEKYKAALLSAADSLARLYNPLAGTILSWPEMVRKKGWTHNTIIDNMLNLELLFWVGQNCNRPDLTEIAARHAEVTMQHIFRPDSTTYHVMVFDSQGNFVAGHTHQGWKDESTWARGQAWAVYGFTMAYRFTSDERFLAAATKAADRFLERLPEDHIPYWDFDAGEQLEDQPRDCSAAAVVASALLELQGYVGEEKSAGKYPGKSAEYMTAARNMLLTMSQAPYRAADSCPAFLLHSTGHKPNGTEVDAALSYADYYYIEALVRLKNLQNK